MRTALGLIGLALLVCWLVLHATGCPAPEPLTPQEKAHVADTTFGKEMLRCVDKAETLEESKACRAAVRERWGVDGGAR